MNERIRELALQAEGTKKHVPAVWQFYDHELEKFAELLVRQCAKIAVGCDVTKYGDFRQGIAQEIKQHFGVEE